MSPSLTPALIQAHSSPGSFERGEALYRQGRVRSLARRGDVLSAEVQGSEVRPYRVTVPLGEGGVTRAACSCPYDWGGFCKHIVAALLAYLSDPEGVEEEPSLEALLEPLSALSLRRALLHLLEQHPETLPTLTLHLALEPSTSSPVGAEAKGSALDPKAIRKQARALLENAVDPDEAYRHDPDLQGLLHKVDDLLVRGAAEDALAVLTGVTEACVEVFEDVYDWQYEGHYEGEDPFDDLDLRWAEAVLSLELTENERGGLLADLLAWRERLDDYGVDAFYVAEAALQQSWDDPAVQALLRGEAADTGEARFVTDALTDLRLKVLERQGRGAEYLNLAAARGREASRLGMMVKQGRAGEVMARYRGELSTPEGALALARTLREGGAAAQALEVARFGLTLGAAPSPLAELLGDASRLELALWAAELAETLGEPNAALDAHVAAFKERPSLASFQKLEALAGESWRTLREELLAALGARPDAPFGGGSTEAKVSIYLHEGLLKRAIRAVENASGYEAPLVRRVMDAALEEHADWVLDEARRRAEGIMNEGKSQRYEEAAGWLKRARAAYDRLNRFDDWTLYLSGLEEKHKRKYRLMDALGALES